jgi:acetolactate synthase regulatory subunit
MSTNQCHLELRLGETQDALVRVLGLLQRRRCRVVQVDFVARDRHYPGRLVICVEPPAGRADTLERWLANLVDVVAVESQAP